MTRSIALSVLTERIGNQIGLQETEERLGRFMVRTMLLRRVFINHRPAVK